MTHANAPAVKPFYSCYVEGGDDLWEAICIDFDISMSGRSLAEVMQLLEYAVRSYVADASLMPEPDRSRLLSRRSPWQVRLKWRLRVIAAGLALRNRLPAFEGHFSLPCHA